MCNNAATLIFILCNYPGVLGDSIEKGMTDLLFCRYYRLISAYRRCISIGIYILRNVPVHKVFFFKDGKNAWTSDLKVVNGRQHLFVTVCKHNIHIRSLFSGPTPPLSLDVNCRALT